MERTPRHLSHCRCFFFYPFFLLPACQITENNSPNALIGSLSTIDPDTADTSFTYAIVSAAPAGLLGIQSGNSLVALSALNYESVSSIAITIRSTDPGGLFVEAPFTITVVNANDAPTDITLVGTSVDENMPTGTQVGTLSTTDQDAGETFTYALSGSPLFTISGNKLVTAQVITCEALPNGGAVTATVQSTDSGGFAVGKQFTIQVEYIVCLFECIR